MSDVKRCSACGKEKPVAEMKTCMHNQMHRYVCDMKCMDDFYNPPKTPTASEKIAALATENAKLRAQIAERDAAIDEWSGTAVQNGMEVDRLRAELAEANADFVRIANEREALRAEVEALKTQCVEPVAHVSEETFSSDGTSDIITCNLPIGTALYTALPATDALVEALEEFSGLLQLAADALSDLYSGTRIEADIRHALETHRASQRKER